jgi:8-oxo-dGTP diphosphatase
VDKQCIIYSFYDNQLRVLLVRHAEGISSGMWALPGGWVNEKEDLDTAAYRILKTHTGLNDVYLEQLKVFGNVDRYPYERVITISYFALVKESDVNIQAGTTVFEVRWFNICELPNLIFDHKEILDFSIQRLQHIVRHEPIGFILLPEKFTLLQLQSLYETILQTSFDKPNFRRKFLKMKLLINLKEKQKNVSHRAAHLYKFDIEVYNKIKNHGFTFDL